MNKQICGAMIFAVLVFGTAAAGAQEADKQSNGRFSIAGVWHADTVRSGGGAEWGFTIAENEWCVRDFITLNGYGGYSSKDNAHFGEISVGDKVLVGGIVPCGSFVIVPYGFVSGEFGCVKTDGRSFFSAPFLADFGGGGGFEFRFFHGMSFFIEYGGGCFIPVGGAGTVKISASGYESLSLGYRTYF